LLLELLHQLVLMVPPGIIVIPWRAHSGTFQRRVTRARQLGFGT
jgi:hypothetical protein